MLEGSCTFFFVDLFGKGAKVDDVLPLRRRVHLRELLHVGRTSRQSGRRKKSQPRLPLSRRPLDLDFEFSLATGSTEWMDVCKVATALCRTQPTKKSRRW